nr:hypothetical protein Hi04_10k_c5482_00026 [uncultured bacterium]
MPQSFDKQARRALREKALIRRVAKNVRIADEGHRQDVATETGIPVEEQVRKRWSPQKGGLPTFLASQEGTSELRQGNEAVFYRSSNGDQWYLIREPDGNRLMVRHQPNRASGGRSSIVEVSEFLSEGHGPQHEALLLLLAT